MIPKWSHGTCRTAAGADHHPLTPVVSSTVTAGTLLLAFSLLALGVESFWIVFVIGFGGVLPLSLGLLESGQTNERSQNSSGTPETPLEELRHRYARGDLTDEEFENRVEALLETEDPNDT